MCVCVCARGHIYSAATQATDDNIKWRRKDARIQAHTNNMQHLLFSAAAMVKRVIIACRGPSPVACASYRLYVILDRRGLKKKHTNPLAENRIPTIQFTVTLLKRLMQLVNVFGEKVASSSQ